jgi:hypothetical protein
MNVQKETMSRAFFYLILFGIAGYSFGGAANPTCSISCAYRSELAHTIAYWGSMVATAGTGLFVLLYWLYTLKEKTALQGFLRWPRTVWFSLPLGIFPLVGFWLHEGLYGSMSLGLFLVFDLYAYRRQWVDGYPASKATAAANEELVPPSAKLVVADDGRAVVLSELERRKLIQVPGTPRLLFVHCRLSRGLNIYPVPDDALMRASLPHTTGFILRCDRAKEHWDSVDGRSYGDHRSLGSVGLRVSTRDTEKDAKVFVVDPRKAGATNPPCIPHLPSAKTMSEPMEWGVVVENQWRGQSARAEGAAYYLARWAAHQRGVSIPPELI